MVSEMQRNIRNSDLNIRKDKRSFLTYPLTGFAPCIIEEMEDSVNFLFDTNENESAEAIISRPKWEQLRFLANCATLNELSREFYFELSLENLLVDINLMPLVLMRDICNVDGIVFIDRYKALIGSVLLHKYKYEDYINGGQDLYKKDKLLGELASIDEVTLLRARILNEYATLTSEVERTKVLVAKKNVLMSRITIPTLACLLLAIMLLSGRMLFSEIPFRDSLITASNAYIHGNHLAVMQTLNNYDIERLSDEVKYFLARSYVSTEALTPVQINNILLGLTRITDPIIFDYWILLGRMYFDEAIDIAQRLGDDELLLFAYLKNEVFVRNDMSLPGEVRLARLSYLENHIDRLTRARDEASAY